MPTYDFPRPGLTVDLVIVSPAREVLLVERRNGPFQGSWALPGGYVEELEPLEAAARRELREETGVEVGELTQLVTVGEPGRDPRGWTVSVVYLARLDPKDVQLAAGDDAADARWFPLAAPPELAFDHALVLDHARAALGPL